MRCRWLGFSADIDGDGLEVIESEKDHLLLGEHPPSRTAIVPALLEVPVVDGDDISRSETFGQSVTI